MWALRTVYSLRQRDLPIAAGASATGASAETTAEVTSSATTTSAEAASAIAVTTTEASAQHVAEQEPEPASAASSEHQENKDEKEDEAEPVGAMPVGLVALDGRGLLGRGKGDVGVSRDDVGDLLNAGLDGRAVLPLLELCVHAAADVADLGVGKDAFKAIAYFDPVLMILDGEDEEDALVSGLGADLPGVFEGGRPGVDVLAVEGFDGDDLNGCVSFGVDLPSEVFDVFLGGRVDNVGEVADVAGGLGKLVGSLGVGKADERATEDNGPYEDAFCSHNAMVRLKSRGGSTRRRPPLSRRPSERVDVYYILEPRLSAMWVWAATTL